MVLGMGCIAVCRSRLAAGDVYCVSILFLLLTAGRLAVNARDVAPQLISDRIESIVTSHTVNIMSKTTTTKLQVLYDGGNGTAVCEFAKMVMFEGRLIYIYKDTPPILPEMFVFWAWQIRFEVELRNASNLTDTMKHAQVAQIPLAAMIWRNWHNNFYHAFGEDVFHVYNLACKYLHICEGSNKTDLTPLFIEKRGKHYSSWADILPAADSALRCFFPSQSYYLQDANLEDQVIVLRKSAVGVGRYDRKFKWVGGSRDKALKQFEPVDRDIAAAYRTRLFECYNVKHMDFEAAGQFHITLINRHWENARHMVNSVDMANRIRSMPEVASVRTVYLETLSFEEQIRVFASSQVVLMTHGAALTGTLFMAPGSTLVMYNWMQIPYRSHNWTLDYMSDLYLTVNFVGQANRDNRLLYPMKEKFIDTPNYAALVAEDKAALLERGVCPPGGLRGCDHLLYMNFAADWDLLKPALETVFKHNFSLPEPLITILDSEWT